MAWLVGACEGIVTDTEGPTAPATEVRNASTPAGDAAVGGDATTSHADPASPDADTRALPTDSGALPQDSAVSPLDSATQGTIDPGATAQQPVFVAVGYAGLRVRSADLGITWTDAQELGGGGDDDFLLRSVSYGAGVFVAAGYRILTSSNGRDWTARNNPQSQWVGGLVYAEQKFVAVGGYGLSLFSDDGVSWTSASGRGTTAARSLAYGNGNFVAATDDGTWFSSADGTAWSALSGGHGSPNVVFCGTDFSDPNTCTLPETRNGGHTAHGQGVYVSIAAGGMGIERSTDGRTWQHVYTSARGLEAITFGDAAP